MGGLPVDEFVLWFTFFLVRVFWVYLFDSLYGWAGSSLFDLDLLF